MAPSATAINTLVMSLIIYFSIYLQYQRMRDYHTSKFKDPCWNVKILYSLMTTAKDFLTKVLSFF